MAGAPKGSRNAAKKPWTDALNYVLENYQGGEVKKGEALREIAKQVVELALARNTDAIHEIAGRLEGRPAQAIHVSGSLPDKSLNEMTDAELIDIIASRRERIAETPARADEPAGVHRTYDA